MIDYEQFCRIKAYRNEGLKVGQIADKLGLDSRTVGKWIDKSRFQPRLPGLRNSKLDPYKKEILAMLERHPYSAVQIFQRIKDQGFDGGVTIVRDYVHKVRPRSRKPYLKLSFAPGECAQVDWGSYGSIAVGSTRRRLSFFVMVLCYSRLMYTEFTVSQTMEHFLGCHQRALQYFGRVPSKVMVDNLKSAVLKRVTEKWPRKFRQAVKWKTCYLLNDRLVTNMEQKNGKENTKKTLRGFQSKSCIGCNGGRQDSGRIISAI